MRRLLSTSSILLVAGLMAAGCTDSSSPSANLPAEVTDAQLYELQKPETGWTYYRLVSDTLMRAGNSAHPDRIVVRYNGEASTRLDAGGMVRADAQFPDSSLIVKDVFTGSTRTIIAYMFKLRAAPNAGPGGWVWAETKDDGTPFISSSTKGAACTPCHSVGIDFTRMNDAHP
jgi:hypothetical protein